MARKHNTTHCLAKLRPQVQIVNEFRLFTDCYNCDTEVFLSTGSESFLKTCKGLNIVNKLLITIWMVINICNRNGRFLRNYFNQLMCYNMCGTDDVVGTCGLADQCWVHKQKVVGASSVMVNVLCP